MVNIEHHCEIDGLSSLAAMSFKHRFSKSADRGLVGSGQIAYQIALPREMSQETIGRTFVESRIRMDGIDG